MPEMENKTIIRILLGAILIFAIYYAIVIPSKFQDFSVEITATLLGLMLAFFLDRRNEEVSKEKERKILVEDIREELIYNANLLDGQGKLIKKDIWDSDLSSGAMQLLKSNQKQTFSKLYHKINNYNYEAIRTRDIAEKYRGISASNPDLEAERKQVWLQWSGLSNNLIEVESKLKKEIIEVLENKILWE